MLYRLAPAKINLGLHVLRRRADGYHDLDTVFLRIPWADEVRAEASDTLTLTCSDERLPVDAGNLVMRAALALREHAGAQRGSAQRGASLHLEKRLPYGAGLGSGSSDAAAALLLLRDLWQTGSSDADLHRIAAGLGADVPFFLGSASAARGTGIGDMLAPLISTDGAPYVCPFPLVVAVPGAAVSTADAYRHVMPRAESRADLAALVASNDLAAWRAHLVNDFEASVLPRYPAVASAKAALLEAGAAYASLSGSGGAVFGAFESEAESEAAAEAMRLAGLRVWHGFAAGV